MPGFWKGPAWLKAKPAPEDDQRPLLVQSLPTPFCLANSSKGAEVEHHPSQERYVGFGIGGAGNIRKVQVPVRSGMRREARHPSFQTGDREWAGPWRRWP